MTTRFPNGLTTASEVSTLETFILPDPSTAHVFFDDFKFFDSNLWVVTNVGTSAIFEDAQAITGEILMSATIATDRSTLQTIEPSFTLEVGKQLWAKARTILGNNPDDVNWIFGLQIQNTDAFTLSDGIYINRANTTGVFLDMVGMTPVQTTLDSSFFDTTTEVAFHYDGIDKVTVFVNDIVIEEVTITSALLSSNLAVTAAYQANASTSNRVDFDYLFVAKER